MHDVSGKRFPIAESRDRLNRQFLHSRDLLFPCKSESARVSRVYLRLFARACSPSCRWAKQGRNTTARNFSASWAGRRAIDRSTSLDLASPLGNVFWRTTMRCRCSRILFILGLNFVPRSNQYVFKIVDKSSQLLQVRKYYDNAKIHKLIYINLAFRTIYCDLLSFLYKFRTYYASISPIKKKLEECRNKNLTMIYIIYISFFWSVNYFNLIDRVVRFSIWNQIPWPRLRRIRDKISSYPKLECQTTRV